MTYNKTVEYLRQPDTKANWMGIKKQIMDSLPEWSKEAPYQVRSIAVKDACEAVKRAKVKYKSTGKFNEVSFRSRKDVRQSVFLPKSAIGAKGIFTRLLGQMRYSEPLPEIKHDCRLVREYGKWFVVIPVDMEKPAETRTKLRSVSFDPGVRTFLTGYCEEGILEIGRRAYEKIMGLCVQYDRMTALMTKVKARRRQNLKRARTRLLYRVECLKKELHWKTATFLAKSFETIVIPEFSAGQMSVKAKRRLVSKTARAMLNLGQSRFREILSLQCEKYGSRMLVVTEEYTSKTCPSCGQLHEKLGGSEVFRCPHCGYVSPRDANGARNIMLRALVDSPTLLKQGVTVNVF